jgi:hypothetical protein
MLLVRLQIVLRQTKGAMEDNFIEHVRHDDHHDTEWGSMKEIAFWTFALLANFGFIIYAAWRLAVRHTEATGSSVLVPMKVDDSVGQSTAVQNARRRGGKPELPQ